MRRPILLCTALLAGVLASGSTLAHDDMDELPEGPVRDRHELMEGIGKNAKIIGEAMKAGDLDKVAGPATEIQKAAKRIPEVFPAGSEHPKSRAKPAVWSDPKGFAFEVEKLQTRAAALADAAHKQEDVPKAANELFDSCKSCHNNFRVPEE